MLPPAVGTKALKSRSSSSAFRQALSSFSTSPATESTRMMIEVMSWSSTVELLLLLLLLPLEAAAALAAEEVEGTLAHCALSCATALSICSFNSARSLTRLLDMFSVLKLDETLWPPPFLFGDAGVRSGDDGVVTLGASIHWLSLALSTWCTKYMALESSVQANCAKGIFSR